MKRLNFGCGNDIKKGWKNVDIQAGKGIDKTFDFNKFPYPIENDTYDYIYSKNVLEHLNHPEKVIFELRRIAKSNSVIEISVPHYTNKGAYNDLQHKHFFNEVCFEMLVQPRTEVDTQKKFKLISLDITPTKVGRIFPKAIRKKLALFVNGLLSQINVKLKVLK